MGGKAFASAAAPGQPTIRTPRMSPEQYASLKELLSEKLQRCFRSAHIGTMIEAPEKESYGDIDFIIASEVRVVDWADVAYKMGATAVLSAPPGITMAVRLDGEIDERPVVPPILYHSSSVPSKELSEHEYAQVDLTLIQPNDFHWWQFYSSYGDLAGILGFVVRKLGFTISDKGLLLRYELLDDAKKVGHLQVSDKSGMLLLSQDPVKVMQFFGLDPVRWQQGFTKMHDLFEWIAQCRLLTREVLDSSKENEWSNSRQKQKERKRTIFPEFLFHYCEDEIELSRLSDRVETQPEAVLQVRRPYLQDEAVKFFGKQDEFIQHFSRFHSGLVVQQADYIIKPLVALHTDKTGKRLAELTRAFRRWVVVGGEDMLQISPVKLPDDESQLPGLLRCDLEGLKDEEMVADFVRENWEALKQLERHAP